MESPGGGEYCLIVSTIESRKNHVLALEAWARLIETRGVHEVPKLVCVGRSGWLNADFFERLARHPRLREAVIVIERVSDQELALLYRECQFTVYPSHYEGWGLPITESLCYGKVPVIANNSSLPEAGGGFALLFESDSVGALVSELERLMFENGLREKMERAIAERFRPRSWSSIAAHIIGAIVTPPNLVTLPSAPSAIPGLYYPVNRYKGVRIWDGLGSGEMFRFGEGWHWPDVDCSRTKEFGGELRFQVTGNGGVYRLYLRLRGLNSCDAAFVISSERQVISSGVLQRGEERWVVGTIDLAAKDRVASVLVRGASTEDLSAVIGGEPKKIQASIAVVGFAIVEQADERARTDFLEEVALGGTDRINAYAERAPATLMVA